MQVTVFGASGKVGRLVVGQLLASDYKVVAFVHRNNPFGDSVTVVRGSVNDHAAVKSAVAGSGVVISCLGSWGTPTKTVVSNGTNAIVAAMTDAGQKRLITLTGASAFYSKDTPTALDRFTRKILSLVAPKILKDGETHLKTLEASSLDWTCIRSPAMTSQSSSAYRLTPKLPSVLATIPRRAVVMAIVEQIEETNHFQQAPVIRRSKGIL